MVHASNSQRQVHSPFAPACVGACTGLRWGLHRLRWPPVACAGACTDAACAALPAPVLLHLLTVLSPCPPLCAGIIGIIPQHGKRLMVPGGDGYGLHGVSARPPLQSIWRKHNLTTPFRARPSCPTHQMSLLLAHGPAYHLQVRQLHRWGHPRNRQTPTLARRKRGIHNTAF